MEAWLSRITTNAFLDEVRRRKRRPAEPLPDDPDSVLPTTTPADAEFEAAHLPEEVQAALRRLQPEYRAAVVLSDVAGLSYADVADALSIPVGTVRSRIHRGRAQLREELARA
jgi:RNA polymerase sigma-70 factor (ECF subfamily)